VDVEQPVLLFESEMGQSGALDTTLVLGHLQRSRPDSCAAARRWRELTDADSQVALGQLFKEGRPVARNVSQAARLFTLAAAQQHAFAQFLLACLRIEGRDGVERDLAQATALLQQAERNKLAERALVGSAVDSAGAPSASYAEAVRAWRGTFASETAASATAAAAAADALRCLSRVRQ
jgi:TPR repeat protein